MKYTLIIIESDVAGDYFNNSADGVRFFGLSRENVNILMDYATGQGHSIIVQKYDKED